MPVTNNLKKQIDLPVFEWLRPTPISTATGGVSIAADGAGSRYMYYIGATVYRYDTISDSWTQIATPPTTLATFGAARYDGKKGYTGRVISCPSSTTLQVPGLYGKLLKGYKIRIISGKGKGQERTITDVSDVTIHAAGTVTAASTSSPWTITDSTKTFTANQYRGYQLRFIRNTGAKQIFKILNNSFNVISYSDSLYAAFNPMEASRIPVTTPVSTAGSQTYYQIESHVITVNSPWNINPDDTSQFMVLSGIIWYATTTGYTLMVYDCLSDVWYNRLSPSTIGVTTNVFGTDLDLEKIAENTGFYLTGSATSGTTASLVDSLLSLDQDRYSSYRIRITSGSAFGFETTISSSNSQSFSFMEKSSVPIDNTSKYEIYGDYDKIYVTGNAGGSMYQHAWNTDSIVMSRLDEYGTINNLAVCWSGSVYCQPISSITNATNTGSATTPHIHNLKVGDAISVSGATNAFYNVTSTVLTVPTSTTFQYGLGGNPGGSATAISSSSTTLLVDASKNWITNEHVGRYVLFQSSATSLRSCRITANSGNSLTITTAAASPLIGGKYMICEPEAFGAITSGSGVATAGATTTLTDSTKNWVTNEHVGRRLKILAGTNHGLEVAITANTATQLTFAAVTTAMDTTSLYSILDGYVKGSGTGLYWLSKPSNDALKGKYLYSFAGNSTALLQRYDITKNRWENVDTFPSNLETLTTGTMYAYDNQDYIYLTRDGTGRIVRLNVDTLSYEPSSTIPYGMGSPSIGNKMEIVETEDGLKFLYMQRHSGQEFWRTLIFW